VKAAGLLPKAVGRMTRPASVWTFDVNSKVPQYRCQSSSNVFVAGAIKAKQHLKNEIPKVASLSAISHFRKLRAIAAGFKGADRCSTRQNRRCQMRTCSGCHHHARFADSKLVQR
jgi:hypothetical protein